jgi:predicted AAA+ superfamily ATPase
MCSPLNVSDLARDVDAAFSTVKTRLSDLAESFMLWPCHREQGLMPKLNAQTKRYFSDPVLARLATVRGHGREPELTQLNEQQLGLSLLRALDVIGTGTVDEYSSLMYYRSKTGSEIDFAGRGLGRAAVESKYVDDDRWGGTRQTFASTPWHGLIASRSATHWEDGISVIPAPILVLLIGG